MKRNIVDIFSDEMKSIEADTNRFMDSVNKQAEIYTTMMPYRAGLFTKNLRAYIEQKILS